MAAGSTYTPIATNTLGSATSSVSFSSFSGYTDLVLVFQTKLTASNAIKVQYNSDTGSNYSYTRLYGIGSGSGSSDRASNASYFDAGFSASDTVNQIIQIMNYANTTTYKTALSRASTEGGSQVFANAWLWRSTSAITSIQIAGASGNLDTGSTFTLYGIVAA
jgi:hypothetical protein